MACNLTTRNALIAAAAMAAVAFSTAYAIRSARGLHAVAVPSAIAMHSLQLSSPVVRAGERVTAAVTLTRPAWSPSGGVTIYVGFDSEVLAGPKEVRIPNGQTSATFTLYSKPLLRGPRTGSISACAFGPLPYRLLTTSVSIVPGALRGVAPSSTAAAALLASSL